MLLARGLAEIHPYAPDTGIVDGLARDSVVLLIPELVLLALAISALVLDSARQRGAGEPGVRP